MRSKLNEEGRDDMRKIDEILEQAKRLSLKDRQRLIEELENLEDPSKGRSDSSRGKKRLPQSPYARTLAAAGIVHSDFTDLSGNKYKHVAAAAANERDDE